MNQRRPNRYNTGDRPRQHPTKRAKPSPAPHNPQKPPIERYMPSSDKRRTRWISREVRRGEGGQTRTRGGTIVARVMERGEMRTSESDEGGKELCVVGKQNGR